MMRSRSTSESDLAGFRGLAGAMIWDLSRDVPEGTLLRAVSSSLCCEHIPSCCASRPNTYRDGDGVAGERDCAPLDAGSIALPEPIRGLMVARSGKTGAFLV